MRFFYILVIHYENLWQLKQQGFKHSGQNIFKDIVAIATSLGTWPGPPHCLQCPAGWTPWGHSFPPEGRVKGKQQQEVANLIPFCRRPDQPHWSSCGQFSYPFHWLQCGSQEIFWRQPWWPEEVLPWPFLLTPSPPFSRSSSTSPGGSPSVTWHQFLVLVYEYLESQNTLKLKFKIISS